MAAGCFIDLIGPNELLNVERVPLVEILNLIMRLFVSEVIEALTQLPWLLDLVVLELAMILRI